jgi:hypothetical protein
MPDLNQAISREQADIQSSLRPCYAQKLHDAEPNLWRYVTLNNTRHENYELEEMCGIMRYDSGENTNASLKMAGYQPGFERTTSGM